MHTKAQGLVSSVQKTKGKIINNLISYMLFVNNFLLNFKQICNPNEREGILTHKKNKGRHNNQEAY